MGALEPGHMRALMDIASSEETMAALDALANDYLVAAMAKLRPPLALDQYGAAVGAHPYLKGFLGRLRNIGLDE